MSGLSVTVDASAIARLGDLMAAAGQKAPAAIARAVNHTGDKARTAMTRSLTVQTGLKRKVVVRALHVTRAPTSAAGGSSAYVIRSAGGNVGLKYFGARETRGGVSSAPWGRRRVFAGTFIKGGRFPNRVPIAKLNGQVMQRSGRGRLPIAKARSGLFIPREMVSGASAASFHGVAETSLPDRLTHELLRILGGG